MLPKPFHIVLPRTGESVGAVMPLPCRKPRLNSEPRCRAGAQAPTVTDVSRESQLTKIWMARSPVSSGRQRATWTLLDDT